MLVRSVVALLGAAAGYAAVQTLQSSSFTVDMDTDTGALLSIINPSDPVGMNWINSPSSAPWLPLTRLWGLGFAGVGGLNRVYWTNPVIYVTDEATTLTYVEQSLQLQVVREFDETKKIFSERYIFTNIGSSSLNIASTAPNLAIYTPFNDHYTNTSDVYKHRCHAHIWAYGHSSSWVKTNQMSGRGPHLGLVLTEGALNGYSVESRDTVTSSNTRGDFLLHPIIPALAPGASAAVGWSLFWHDDWEDFFSQAETLSTQFVRFNATSLTAFPGETIKATISGNVDDTSTITASSGSVHLIVGSSGYVATYIGTSSFLGEVTITLTTGNNSANMIINLVPAYKTLLEARTHFIATNQQISPLANAITGGAYAVYDNQMAGIASFDTATDRNTGRERVGMGVLMARYLRDHPDANLQASFVTYYTYVINKLQDSTGYVYDGPLGSGDTKQRLYNWSWVMELHLAMAALNISTTAYSNSTTTPLQRFVLTAENFYKEGGIAQYPIGTPIFDGLTAVKASGDNATFSTLLNLFTAHGDRMIANGINYPPLEVNYEQSIVAAAAAFLLDLYRFTGNETWFLAATPHFNLTLLFGGQQPDYHLYDIAIRHWDGYWFGKDRMWGNIFPHYWSTISAIAMHRYGKAVGDDSWLVRADNVFRSNMALFTAQGQGSCAWLYPVTVNGRAGHYKDGYANDQDWALAHLLQIMDE